jgi:hypothetical protein
LRQSAPRKKGAVRRAVLLVSAALAFAAAGCGGDGDKSAGTTTTNPTGTASVTTHGRYKYPPVVVNNFMQSCVNGMENRQPYCACTLDKLSNDVSVRDFARIGLSGGKLSPRIRRLIAQAAVDCRDRL